jgi:hypothetical protein
MYVKLTYFDASGKIGTAALLLSSEMWTIVVPSEPQTSLSKRVLCTIQLRHWLVAGGSLKPAHRRGWHMGQRSPPLRRWDELQGHLLAKLMDLVQPAAQEAQLVLG